MFLNYERAELTSNTINMGFEASPILQLHQESYNIFKKDMFNLLSKVIALCILLD